MVIILLWFDYQIYEFNVQIYVSYPLFVNTLYDANQ